jgi:hypothetical protein
VAKITKVVVRRQLNVLPVAGQGTSEVLPQPQTATHVSREGGNCPSHQGGRRSGNASLFVPVVSSTGQPLMPCHPARARELVRKGRALRRFSKGLFYLRLLDRAEGTIQPVACGIDPGSKQEGLTVKSEAHTFLNLQADAVTWVKDALKARREMRRGRRFRKTPCRQPRFNRARGGISPSTKARWQWKLRIARWLSKLYPISVFVVEEVKARTKGQRRWDASFSPLEVGKRWFYGELSKIAEVRTKTGWETKVMRDAKGLKKIGSKTADDFRAHCVDSWVLASSVVGGEKPENTRLMCVTPLRFHRRQLHALQPARGGIRRPYGGTRSLGFKRGSLVKHPKYGVTYVGGTMNGRLSLHSLEDGKRLCQNAKPSDCQFLAYASWRTRLLPGLKTGVSAA